MKRLLLDVNVVLDVLLDRPPFAVAARGLWAAAERKEIEALIPAHGATTVFYLAQRQKGPAVARRVMEDLLAVAQVATVDEAVLRQALALRWPDFEDAVCAAAAVAAGCEMLVTRDPAGFRDAPLPAVDPLTAVSLISDRVEEGRAAYARRSPRGGTRAARRRRLR